MSEEKSEEKYKLPRWIGNTIAGMTQATLVTITGYPFDLVKSKMQVRKTPYVNSVQCVKDIVKTNGLRGLYRGSMMPWMSHMIKRPLQFPVSEYLKSKFTTDDPIHSIRNNYIIGAGCGVFGPLFGTPLQVVKVGMQTSSSDAYSNSFVYAKNVVNSKGIKGLYRGFVPTVIKDSIFGGSFVGTYYSLRDHIGTDKWYKNFFNGAIAHCFTWYMFIPIDYVKTNIQRNIQTNIQTNIQRNGGGIGDGTRTKKAPTIIEVIQKGYSKGGIRIFWKGVLPACARTIPVSGIAMTGYEYVRKMLLGQFI